MKFKVGDRVRFVRATLPYKKDYIGKEFTIRYDYGDDTYSIGQPWFVRGIEIELVKPKFNATDYTRTYAMQCKTDEEADILLKYLRSIGRSQWRSELIKLHKANVYCFNANCFATIKDVDRFRGIYTILNFEDFDWSDFTMKKEFTKKDLKNGDVVKWSDGDIEIVCVDTGTLINRNGYDSLNKVSEDLVWCGLCTNKPNRIVAVRRPNEPRDCQFSAFSRGYGNLVYEYKEVEEMTLEEVCKALGKEIKIVKEK